MIIGFDLDEVLADYISAYLEYHNDKFNTEYSREDFFTWNFWEVMDETREETLIKIYDFHNSDYFHSLKPIDGTFDFVKKLSINNTLIIVTSRQNDIELITRKWVDEYFPNIFNSIHFTNSFSKEESKISKGDICKNEGVEIFIEDNLKYAFSCVDGNRKIFLINTPWNQCGDLPENVFRVSNLSEIKFS